VGSITKIIREHKVIVKHRPHFGNAIDRSRSRALHDVKTCQKFSGETQAKQEGSIMESEMAAVLLLDEKIVLYKVKSRYTAKFLAAHYEISTYGSTLL
jgi:hypothetical protein